MAVQDTRQKPLALTQSIDFFRAGSKNISTYRSPHAQCFEHASIYSPSIRSPSWERKRIRFNGDISPVHFYIYNGASDHSSNLERDHARAMNELAGSETFVSFLFFVFISSCLCTKLKQYSTAFTTNHLKTVPYCTHPSRVKSVQYAPKTDPKLKQYRTAPTPFASNHCSIFADPPLINNTNNCPIFPPALGSALFPFLPEICTLRQVANKLYGYIYSALATYFYAVIYLHHEDIDGHLLRQYDF